MGEEAKIKKAQKNLETACSLIGWEESDDFDKALHIKNFLKACIEAEKVGTFDLPQTMELISKNKGLTHYLEKTNHAINLYIEKLDKVGYIDGNREETLRYAENIQNKVQGLAYQLAEEKKKELSIF